MKFFQVFQQLSDEEILAVVLQKFSIYIWILALVQFFVLELAPFKWMNALTMHGKLGNLIQNGENLKFLMVPKSLFTYFYLLGFLLSVSLVTLIIRAYSIAATLQTFTATVLFVLHCWRRYLECLFITMYGDSKLHIVYWLGGMAHYVFVVLSFWATALEEKQRTADLSNLSTIVFAFALFVISNWLQFQSHYTLYLLKLSLSKKNESDTSSSVNNRYPLPKGGGFDYCVCPHYLAEIGIYLSLAILTNWSISSWLLLVWVVCNLSYTATQHYEYYMKHFSEEMEKRRLAILFPFVW